LRSLLGGVIVLGMAYFWNDCDAARLLHCNTRGPNMRSCMRY